MAFPSWALPSLRIQLLSTKEVHVANFPEVPPRRSHGEHLHAKFVMVMGLDCEIDLTIRENLIVLLQDFFGYMGRRSDDCGYLTEFQAHQWAVNLGKIG
ncbi:hypothetical protein LINPERHAP1_LOCUS16847 [Linum perenne]